MTDNQQPFSPPLTAEERDAWDLVYMGCCVQNTVESSAKHADEAIHERRRRFGVPGPTAQDLCAQELFRKVCDKSEIDTLRAEVERLTKDVQVRENVYRIRCEQVDALVARAEKAEKERDEARAELERERMRLAACGVLAGCNTEDSLAKNLVMHPDYMSSSAQSVADAMRREMALRARAEKAEKERDELSELYDQSVTQRTALKVSAEKAERELAAARPVLGAVMEWFDPSGDGQTHANYSTLRAYADAQHAARAAKEGGAS